MSVYKPPKSRFFHYDFQSKGRRFHGSTGVETRRKAEAVERRIRDQAATGALDSDQLTLNQAAGKWWAEVGQALKDGQARSKGAKSPIEFRLEQLLGLIGATTPIADIDQTVVAIAIEKRRGRGVKRSKAKDAKTHYPANATVNKAVIDTLRPILKRAATHWGAKGLPAIDWQELRLDEPRETVRVYGPAERARWIDEASRTGWYAGTTPRKDAADLALALDLLLTYGMRVSELFFPPSSFEPDGPRLVWWKGRKGDVLHSIPLKPDHAAGVAARVGRAEAAGLEHIWFYELRGKLVPISIEGLTERLNNAAARAGVKPGRVLHGARHHAGTTFQRTHGNLKLTQRLLGHTDIKSTMRYLHADEADLRTAFASEEAITAIEPGAKKA